MHFCSYYSILGLITEKNQHQDLDMQKYFILLLTKVHYKFTCTNMTASHKSTKNHFEAHRGPKSKKNYFVHYNLKNRLKNRLQISVHEY